MYGQSGTCADCPEPEDCVTARRCRFPKTHLLTDEQINDPIHHPRHYTQHPSGLEHIQVTEHMNFCLGNAIKYIWRAGQKGDPVEDLKKAAWYIEREIKRLSPQSAE